MNVKSKKAKTLLSMCNLQGIGLEIGGGISPLLPKSKGFNIETLDIMDKKSQIEQYESWGIKRSAESIQEVDNTMQKGGSYVDAVGKTSYFDFIAASCVIEHTVCIISFLRDCMELLRPDGILALAVPDKRFIFDHYRPLSGIAEAIDCYNKEDKSRHSTGILCEQFLNYVAISNNGYSLANSPADVKNIIDSYISSDGYRDFHHWVFTKSSFELLLLDLISLGFLNNLRIISSHSQGVEFYVNIQKTEACTPEIDNDRRLELLREIEKEQIDKCFSSDNTNLIAFCRDYKSDSLYIYGTGYSGYEAALILDSLDIEFNGFIVSDERPKPDLFMSHPVYHLSDLNFTGKKTGIILAMTAASTESVVPLLEARGVTDYIEV